MRPFVLSCYYRLRHHWRPPKAAAAIIDHLRHHHHQQQHKKTTACEIMLWPFFAAHPIIALSMWINWSRQATQAHASLYADCGNTPNMRLWCKLSTPLVKDRFQYPVSDRLKKTVNAVFYFLLWSRSQRKQDFQVLDEVLLGTLYFLVRFGKNARRRSSFLWRLATLIEHDHWHE